MLRLEYVQDGDYRVRLLQNMHDSEINVVKLILELVRELMEAFHFTPELYALKEETAIGVLFHNAFIEVESFLDEYGYLMEAINQKQKLFIQGQITAFEEAKIEIHRTPHHILYQKYNATGKNFENLQHLYLKIQMQSEENVDFLSRLLKQMFSNQSSIAVEPKYDGLEVTNDLYEKTPGLYYRYIDLEKMRNKKSCIIEALRMEQMMFLWETFFKQGKVAGEFHRLERLIAKGESLDLLKWEIALNRVIRKNQMQLNLSENDAFSISDQNGTILQSDQMSTSAAQKLLRRFLFPVSSEKETKRKKNLKRNRKGIKTNG